MASEYSIPVEAVHEAIDYCIRNKELLDAERAEDRWPCDPKDYQHEA